MGRSRLMGPSLPAAVDPSSETAAREASWIAVRVERMTDRPRATTCTPPGCGSTGARVVVVGGGRVAQRRIPYLLAAGAMRRGGLAGDHACCRGPCRNGRHRLAPSGRYGQATSRCLVRHLRRPTTPTSTTQISARGRRARGSSAYEATTRTQATAWTPATGRHGPLTVAVLGSRDPKRSASVRDEILTRLRSGEIAAPKDRAPRARASCSSAAAPAIPDLITVAGRRALQEADVVVADRLAPQQLLAELAPDVELIDAAKLPRGRAASQEAINAVMVERAKAGKSVVRFKGGDSFVFGRGFEEALACAAAGVPCPRDPRASPVPSRSRPERDSGDPSRGRPRVHGASRATCHQATPNSLVDWDALGRLRGTLVLLMAVENLALDRRRADGRRTTG